MILEILYIALVVVIIKIVYNLYYFAIAKKYFAKYEQYVQNFANNKTDWSIQENKHKIVGILKTAGLKDANLSVMEPGGFGYLKTTSFSLFDNIPLLTDTRVIQLVVQYFKEAQGVFKNRAWDSINPFYWLESIIFLPKKLFSYLGVSADGLVIKIFQILWWLIVAASTIIGIVFNSEFRTWFLAHYGVR